MLFTRKDKGGELRESSARGKDAIRAWLKSLLGVAGYAVASSIGHSLTGNL